MFSRLAAVLCVLWGVAQGFNNSLPFSVEEEDALLTVPQLIRKYGYEVEEYEVPTEDGYLLSMYRIPGQKGAREFPVLMMHSLFSSCSDWVLIGRKHGLAYLLADRGYDIWMGNARGNRYSRKHQRLSVTSHQFWDFTFHEIGYYDVTALIDFVLDRTGAQRLHYIGFSQGAMTSFVALSSRPEYNEKIVQLHALSPAVYMYRSGSAIIRLLTSLLSPLSITFKSVGINEFLPHLEQQYYLFRWLCPTPGQNFCRAVVHDVAGPNPTQLNAKMLRIFLGHFPAGASTKQVRHYAQIINDGIFRQFDYNDIRQNREAYGTRIVPRYNLSQVTVQVRTYFGYNDNTVVYQNVLQLESELPNVVGSYPVPDKRFSHVDFILANNVREILYREIINNVEQTDRKS
ncbi:lipase 1-like [Ochlerotatus camptorhynchus]|uniref:lipase 1-like n=1 Tax=Ochlerotatus camptorhynchus TaxID=644619 RepID=UPI0031D86152